MAGCRMHGNADRLPVSQIFPGKTYSTWLAAGA